MGPRSVTACYDLEATVLDVEADGPELLEGLNFFIGERRLAAKRRATFRLGMAYGTPPSLPEGADILYRGPLLAEGVCLFGRTDDAYWLTFPDAATLSIRPQARSADLIVGQDGLRHAHGNMIAIALEFAFDADGQQIVHCAGLSHPDSDRAILLCAPSGTGKTTTALALARAGFGLAADDAMVLQRQGDDIRTWGLPRAVKIHRKTARLLPWLASVQGERWDDADEQAVERKRLGQLVRLDDRSLLVGDLILLKRPGTSQVALRQISRTEMLAALAADNVRRAAGGLIPLQARRYSQLANAVQNGSTFELAISGNLNDIVSAVHAMRG